MRIRLLLCAASGAAVTAVVAAVWWGSPSTGFARGADATAAAAPTSASHLHASPLAPVPRLGERSSNGVFGIGPGGELLFDQRAAGQLDALAQSLPRDLSEDELLAIDEFAAAGLQEPAASEARRIVRDYLARRGIGIVAIAAPPAQAATPVPDLMPPSLLASRPPVPEGDGVLRYPGMGDETD